MAIIVMASVWAVIDEALLAELQARPLPRR
jgi:hypothetical protein